MDAALETGHQNIRGSTRFPSVYAVVVCMNGFEDTSRCVRSLLRVEYPNLRVIVADNGSTDGSAERLRCEFPGMQIIANHTNEGYAAGCNSGIRAALAQGAEYVLLSNSDIVVERDFLSLLVESAEQSAEIGVAIPTIRYLTDPRKIYYAAGRMSRLFCTGLTTTSRSISILQAGLPVDVSFVNGALCLFRREVFERSGLLDERFFLYHDDNEFSLRYGKAFRMVYVPHAVVYHKSGAGRGWQGYNENYLYYYTRNRIWLFAKDTPAYGLYVVLFTIVNAAAKSMFILPNLLSHRDAATRQLAALWAGARDGIRIWAYDDREAASRRYLHETKA